ncbi:hypothetical protein ES702_01053 [subsurface metagenome]
MNYYLPRYDLPLVLGYTGPGLSFYSPGSEKANDLIPSFSRQEGLLTKSKNLEDRTSKNSNDLINTFFSDKVGMMRATLENILSQIEERKRIKERNVVSIRKDMCKCQSYLLQIEALANLLYTHDISMGRRRTNLDGQMFSLKKDLRSEDLSYWRDLVFLKKEFMENLKEYQAAKKRNELLSTNYLNTLEDKVEENERH